MIQRAVMHGDSQQMSITQRLAQCSAINTATETGQHYPTISKRIKAAVIDQQMPPANARWHWLWSRSQQLESSRSGKVHQTQLGGSRREGQQGVKRQQLTVHRIGRPAQPQGVNPFSYKTSLS